MDTIKDWTNKEVKITDIRKLSEFYIFTIDTGEVGPLLVKSNIFEERLKTYFLSPSDILNFDSNDIFAFLIIFSYTF